MSFESACLPSSVDFALMTQSMDLSSVREQKTHASAPALITWLSFSSTSEREWKESLDCADRRCTAGVNFDGIEYAAHPLSGPGSGSDLTMRELLEPDSMFAFAFFVI